MTYEERVLAVLDHDVLTKQMHVVKAARMAPEIAADSLRSLLADGVIERFTAHTGRRGRPAYLYRRRGTEAAA